MSMNISFFTPYPVLFPDISFCGGEGYREYKVSDCGFELWGVVEFAGWSVMWWITAVIVVVHRGVCCLET